MDPDWRETGLKYRVTDNLTDLIVIVIVINKILNISPKRPSSGLICQISGFM